MTTPVTPRVITADNIERLRAAFLAGTKVPSDTPAILVPSDMTVQSLEHLELVPMRCRRTFKTNEIEDFLAYVANQLTDLDDALEPHLFVSREPPCVEAIIDFGGYNFPQWAQHRALWTPQLTPVVVALQALTGRNLDQDTLMTWIDDWSDYLSFERADGSAVPVPAARAAIADLTAEALKTLRSKTGDFERERSALERISMAPTVPARMLVTCTPYRGFSTQHLRVRIAAADGAAQVALRLTLLGWPGIEEQLILELDERLAKADLTATICHGSIQM